MVTYLLSGVKGRRIRTQLKVLTIFPLVSLCLSACLAGCTVQQQQEVVDATIGRAFGRGRNTSQAQPVLAASPSPSAPAPTAPVNAGTSSESEQLLLLWQKTLGEYPQIYLDCLQDAQCGPALKGYLYRLQQQASRSLELPPAYDSYNLRVP